MAESARPTSLPAVTVDGWRRDDTMRTRYWIDCEACGGLGDEDDLHVAEAIADGHRRNHADDAKGSYPAGESSD
jgi:hypothetical protein